MAAPTKTPWSSVQRTAGQTRWQSVTIQSNTVTRKVTYRTNSFVELGAGLNITNASGQFVSANPSFTITPTGAEARGAAHQVIVPGDIGTGEGVRVIMPGGEELVFQPLAIDYFDPVDGQGVLLDVVTNAVGWLVASNEIVFSNCFTHIKASIRLRNTRAGLESDLILHESPPEPETFGLSSSARLEMLTEQLAGPVPTQRPSVLYQERDPVKAAAMLEPNLVDTELTYGAMKMGAGRAFLTPATTNVPPAARSGRVAKSFLEFENRRIIIEAVEHRRVRPALLLLPPATKAVPQASLSPLMKAERLAKNTRRLPALARPGETREAALRHQKAQPVQQARLASPGDAAVQLASASASAPAFVLDYVLTLNTDRHDFTFRGDTTYHVTTPVLLTGTTTIEGGTVVKFDEGTGVFMFEAGTLICDTTHYLPAVFTSKDDDSVGEDIGSGSPVQIGTWGLYFISGGSRELSNVRFTWLSNPIAMEGGGSANDLTLRNVQVRKSDYVVDSGTTDIAIYNGLFADVGMIFLGADTFLAEHVTVHNATVLGDNATTATVRNSLLVQVANAPSGFGSYIKTSTTNLASATNLFQTVEGGGYYLAGNTYRNAGTTNINAALRATLTNLTTHAPEILSGTLTTNRTLTPRAIRDTDAPDLGYHYPAVDYLAKTLVVENATLSLLNGVVVAGGFASNSLWTPALRLNPGKLLSLGTPARLNRLLRANQVQENVRERGYTLLQDGQEGAFKPEITLRFTELSSLADEMNLLEIAQATARFESSHSAFRNGRHLPLTLYGGSLQTVGLTNNLFHSTHVLLTGNSYANFGAVNNLFKDGAFTLAGGNSSWTLSDNIFDRTALTNDASTVTTASNAYVAVAAPFTFDTAPVVLTNLAYASGPLGRYYVSGTALQNAGSRTADAAGLYHFTTRTNQVKETNSQVDIGLHYLAGTVVNGQMVLGDADGDGVPDYVEDANGNGTREAEETSATRADSPFLPRDYEPLGPSSGRTPLVISEIMYRPASGGTEFIELYNTHYLPQKLDGFTLVNVNDNNLVIYSFTNSTLAPGNFIHVTPVSSLPDASAKLQLRNSRGAVLLEVKYSAKTPWPAEANGAGHSLVLARPSYGENDPRAWAASAVRGGSPGYPETNRIRYLRAVKINEVAASSPYIGAIELYNAANQAVDISGCFLSNDPANLSAFEIPAGTVLPPRGFANFLQSVNFQFSVAASGSLFLSAPDLSWVIDGLAYETIASAATIGRSPDGSPGFVELATSSYYYPPFTNSPAKVQQVVINEIMYHPNSESILDEFVELYNAGTNSVNLHNWKLDGAVSLTIANFTLGPGKFLVLARDPALLAARYPTNQLVISSNLFALGWPEALGDGGDRITLKKSGVIMDEVTYADGGRWGRWSDGDGSSLELLDPRSDNRLAANWADSQPLTSAAWTSLSVTGIVQLISPDFPPPAALELMMLGAGECLVDEVEVIDANGVNRIGNGSFDSACLTVLTNEAATCGTNAGSCWFAQGTHEFSVVQTNGGTTNGPALLVRTTGSGDYVANRIVTCWSTALSTGTTCIIRAKVKWLRGHPELVFRLRGGYMEGVAHMNTVAGGTPGRTNSVGLTNAPPALWDVSHFPVVPTANELVTVTARTHDADGVTNFVLRYRLDASATYTAVAMRDDGTAGDALAGDGLFSAVLPAQTSGTVIAFLVEATDRLGATNRFPKAETVFPGDTFRREAVVHFGDGQPTGNFGTYRLWLTAASYNQWANRNRVHNSPVDATFVYGSSRAIYNAGAKYSGSVYSSKKIYNTPIGNLCGYALDFPSDDRFLGATGASLDFDSSDPRYMVSEQLALSLAGRLELPYNYRRFHHLYVRGVQRTSTAVYEDAQQPNSDFLAEWYPDRDEGELFKMEFWWTVADLSKSLIGYEGALLQRHNRTWPGTTNTSLDIAGRYRLTWLPRAVQGSADDYRGFSNLVVAVDSAGIPYPHSNAVAKIDEEQWMRTFMLERVLNNTDSYGFQAGHNMYAYHHLANGLRWQLLTIDFDNVFRYDLATGTTNYTPDPFRGLGGVDPTIWNAMFPHPPFRRALWRCLYDLANPLDGLLLTNTVWPIFFGGVNALVANGFTVPSTASTNSPQNFIATQQPYYWNRLAEVRPVQAILSPTNGASFPSNTATITLTGVAPVEVRGLRVNGVVATNLVWSTVTNWSLTVPLVSSTNQFTLAGYDRKTNALPVRDKGGYTNSIYVTR